MQVQIGLIVAAAAIVVATAVLSWRRIQSFRSRETLDENRPARIRNVALVAGAFLAIVVVVTVTALGLR